MTDEPAAALFARLVAWAHARRDVRAVAVVGSRARRDDHPADEWSDVDVLLMVTRPGCYLATDDWLAALGRPWLTYVDPTPVGGRTERRATFEGALEVDFVIVASREMRLAAHALRLLERFPRARRLLPPRRLEQLAAASDIFRRGMRVLVDKDGTALRLERAPVLHVPQRPPSAPVFQDAIFRFWHWTIWVAKHLHRGELWRVKAVAEPHRNQVLLEMLEWHARARHGWDYDTWDRGRFLEEWADPRAVAALRGVFGAYDVADLWRALFATIDLFRWLANETAAGLRYRYPTELDQQVTAWVCACHRRVAGKTRWA